MQRYEKKLRVESLVLREREKLCYFAVHSPILLSSRQMSMYQQEEGPAMLQVLLSDYYDVMPSDD